MRRKTLFLTVFVFSFITTGASTLLSQQQITVIGWNAESGGSNPDVVAARIADINGCDIWGVCEVLNSNWAEQFEQAAEDGEGADFRHILGTTGGGDRMEIIYDANRFALVDSFELHRINVSGRVRSPLVAHFKINGTNIEFLFMINHLYRSRAERRAEQARLLNLWGSQQTLPIIAVGDYNFDWEVDVGDRVHDPGYDEMTSHGYFNWVRPEQLKKTQASSEFDSVLDFIFLGGNSWTWKAESTILKRDANDNDDEHLTDDNQTSDHRPVQGVFTIE